MPQFHKINPSSKAILLGYLRKTFLAVGIFAFLFVTGLLIAHASYLPGQTLNPSCAPTDPDCFIQFPSSTASALAASSTPGAIQLSGDLGGSATSVAVTGIQGNPIATTTPTSSQVLAWNGSEWMPSNANSTASYPGVTSDGNDGLDVAGNVTAGTMDGVWNYCSYPGMHCDDATDDTAAFNALLQAVYNAGGGEILGTPGKTSLILGQITIPNNGAPAQGNGKPGPAQPTIELVGMGGNANGSWQALSPTAFTLDLRYNAPVAKILTLGQGLLDISNVNLIDNGTDCAPFLLTTYTTLHIRDSAFQGTASGASACNDAILLGGQTTTFSTDTTSPFQGYDSIIDGNYFSRIRRAVWFRNFANSNTISNNTISSTSGDPTGGAFVIQAAGGAGSNDVNGNLISGNVGEVTHYRYLIDLEDGAYENTVIANGCNDGAAPNFLGCVYVDNQTPSGTIAGVGLNLISCSVLPGGSPCLVKYQADTNANMLLDQNGRTIYTTNLNAHSASLVQATLNGGMGNASLYLNSVASDGSLSSILFQDSSSTEFTISKNTADNLIIEDDVAHANRIQIVPSGTSYYNSPTANDFEINGSEVAYVGSDGLHVNNGKFTVGSSTQFSVDANGNQHQNGSAPTASVGTITGTNAGGYVSGLSAATSLTLTFANSGWGAWASCVANTNVASVQPYVSSISKTGVTFAFPSLTGTLYYHCDGN